MKKSFIAFIAFVSLSVVALGSTPDPNQEKPNVGDKLVVSKHTGETFKHIEFPRLNLLVKRGSIASYKSVHNTEVVITEVVENEFGRIDVKLERADGKKFFNHKKSVMAHYEKAISSGELEKT